jgi:nucleotide-binding universal stress UspA family protein
MFNKVVVGVDEHQGGRDAVALAKQLTAPTGELTLAHVYALYGEPSIRGCNDEQGSEIERSREILEAVSANAHIDAKLRWTGADSVGRGLHELVETLKADLLVLGSTRRGLLWRVLIGDDTRAALDGAPSAVAIAPAGYAERAARIEQIGVGYDGSPDSERALAVARELSAELAARVLAMQVVFFPAYLFSGPVAADSTSIAELIDDARRRVASLGNVDPRSAYGRPAEELAIWSESLDLLIVGSRGYGPIGRLVHGSTSQELARRARCPLLVLPRPRTKATERSTEATGEVIGSSLY